MSRIAEWTEDDRSEILRQYGRTPESLNVDVESIKTWLKQQPHLPEIPEDTAIATFFLLQKCSVERAKQKLDMYYTIRGLIPELFSLPPDDPRIKCMPRVATYVPLPKLLPDKQRLTWVKLVDPRPERFDFGDFFSHVLHVLEVRIREDLFASDVLVYDTEVLQFGHLATITPAMIRKTHTVVQKVYSSRYSAVHFVHRSAAVEKLIALSKMVLPEKIAKRIRSHKNIDALADFIPKRFMPKDYGGEQPTLEELNAHVAKRIEANGDRLRELMALRTDEKLRPGRPVNVEMLGLHGNFRKLDVD